MRSMKIFKHKKNTSCWVIYSVPLGKGGGRVTSLYAIDVIIRKVIWLPEPYTVI